MKIAKTKMRPFEKTMRTTGAGYFGSVTPEKGRAKGQAAVEGAGFLFFQRNRPGVLLKAIRASKFGCGGFRGDSVGNRVKRWGFRSLDLGGLRKGCVAVFVDWQKRTGDV